VFSNSDEVLRFISDEGVEYVDVRFCDLPGVMQHLTVPASAVDADFLEDGIAFDGSSVRGFQAINESDMALLPDPATARVDPFRKHKTLNINFFVHDPLTGGVTAATRATWPARPRSTWPPRVWRTTCFFGAEAEFYIFDSVRFGSDPNQQYHHIDSVEGWWNTAWAAGKTVTFMPKPLFGDNGSGMHAHQSLWKDGWKGGSPLFHDESGYGGLSDTARHYIGGLLHHAPGLLAFTNPTLEGGVFTPDVIETWINLKRENEFDPVRLRPRLCGKSCAQLASARHDGDQVPPGNSS
jgi:glutamine synthetase